MEVLRVMRQKRQMLYAAGESGQQHVRQSERYVAAAAIKMADRRADMREEEPDGYAVRKLLK